MIAIGGTGVPVFPILQDSGKVLEFSCGNVTPGDTQREREKYGERERERDGVRESENEKQGERQRGNTVAGPAGFLQFSCKHPRHKKE